MPKNTSWKEKKTFQSLIINQTRETGTEKQTYIVAHEEVISVRVGASNLEQLHQVVELSVDVTADCDGAFLVQS